MGIKQNLKYISQSTISSGFTILISVIRTKIISVLIGTAGIGILGQLTNLINISNFILTLGLPTGLVNEISKSRTQNNKEHIEKLRIVFFISTVWASLIVSIIVFIFSHKINAVLFPNNNYSMYINLIALYISTLGLGGAYNAFLSANKLVTPIMYLSIITSFLNSLFTVVFIYFYSMDGIVYGILVNGIINGAVGYYFCRLNGIPSYIKYLTSYKFLNTKLLMQLLKYGSISIASSIAIQISSIWVMSFLIKNTDTHGAGIYQAASNLSNQYLNIFIVAVNSFILAHLAEIHNPENLKKEFNNSLRLLLLLSFPVLLIILCYSKLMIPLFYSNAFSESAELLSLLTVFGFLKICSVVILPLVIVKNHFTTWIVTDILFSFWFPFTTYLLYPYFNLKAPILSNTLGIFIALIIYLFILYKKDQITLNYNNIFLFFTGLLLLIIHFLVLNKINFWEISILVSATLLLFYYIGISKLELIKLINLAKIKIKWKK